VLSLDVVVVVVVVVVAITVVVKKYVSRASLRKFLVM